MKLKLARVMQREKHRFTVDTEKACAGDSAPFVPQDKQKECGFDKRRRFVSLKRKKTKHPTLRKGREGWGTRKI
jgi:hypothetical protein